MAYTGTGTQADPFVVTTFADFLTCVAQDGVYVKVDADIDAAAEGYDYIDPIDVKAIKVYADSLKKISNVTVEGNALFDLHNGTGEQSIMQLHLENWAWKAMAEPRVTSHVPVMFYRSNGSGYVRYCKVSVSVTPQTSDTTYYLHNLLTIADSAIVVQQHGGKFLPQPAQNSVKRNTTIRIEGSNGATYPSTSANANRFGSCTNVGIILKGMIITGSFGFYGGNGFGYMVCEDCTVPASGTVFGVNASNLICFAGTTDASGLTVDSGTQITQAQLKDKAYLQSIGWLP